MDAERLREALDSIDAEAAKGRDCNPVAIASASSEARAALTAGDEDGKTPFAWSTPDLPNPSACFTTKAAIAEAWRRSGLMVKPLYL